MKPEIDERTFDQLYTGNLYNGLKWLQPLHKHVERIVNFGCCNSSEPFALLWHLRASEITVVEIEANYLTETKSEEQRLRKNPETKAAMENRLVEFIVADMTQDISQLQSNNYDLAFCQQVLYQICDSEAIQQLNSIMPLAARTKEWYKQNEQARFEAIENNAEHLQHAIGQMARIINPSGFVIAVEPPFTISPRLDISRFFTDAGLEPIQLPSSPEGTYSYRKPTTNNP